MLGVILTILKILGIIIVSILGLIILLLILILFVPVRYMSKGEFYEQKSGTVVLSYLFHLLHFKLNYSLSGDGVKYVFKILGFKVAYSGKPEKIKKEKKSKTKKEKVKKTKINKQNMEKKQPPKALDGEDKNVETKLQLDDVMFTEEVKPDNIIQTHQRLEKDAVDTDINIKTETKEEYLPDSEASIFEKIHEKIVNMANNVKSFFCSLRNKVCSIISSAKLLVAKLFGLKNKMDTWVDYLTCENTKKVIELLKTRFKILLKHIRPRKFRAKIHYGFDDPALTGQTLAAITMIYGFIYKNIEIEPDFENKIIEGKYYLRGRVQLIVILVAAIKIYFNKYFKKAKHDLPA